MRIETQNDPSNVIPADCSRLLQISVYSPMASRRGPLQARRGRRRNYFFIDSESFCNSLGLQAGIFSLLQLDSGLKIA